MKNDHGKQKPSLQNSCDVRHSSTQFEFVAFSRCTLVEGRHMLDHRPTQIELTERLLELCYVKATMQDLPWDPFNVRLTVHEI